MTDGEKFAAAGALALADGDVKGGIGTLGEGYVHKILKYYLEPNAEKREVEYLGFVADIKNAGGITEIQTGSFDKLLPKLERFLKDTNVTLVCPVISNKTIYTTGACGELLSSRKSPRHKSIFDAAIELYKIRDYLTSPRLTVRVVFLSACEYKSYGAAKNKKGTLIPNGIENEVLFSGRDSYRALLPDKLDTEFFAKDYYKAIASRSRYSYYALKLCEYLGFIKNVGKRGKAFIYRRIKS